MKDYRFISNLPFIWKRIKRVLWRPIEEHLEHNDLNASSWPAYHRDHSLKTVLLTIHIDIAGDDDETSATVLIMLDSSAAFNVISHSNLPKRFKYSFGNKEKALSWLKSYLTHKIQCVSVAVKIILEFNLLKLLNRCCSVYIALYINFNWSLY